MGAQAIAAALVVSGVLGVPPLRNVASPNYISFSQPGDTLPATGYVRTPSRTTTWWQGRNGGGDSAILAQNGGALTFGDSGAAAGWSATYQGFAVTVQSRTGLTFYSQNSAASVTFANFSGATIDNISFEIAGAGGGNSKIRFGENVVAFIHQAQAVTNNNGSTLTLIAQAAKAGSGGNGGNFEIQTGANDGAGSAGSFVLKSGTAVTRVTVNDGGTWTFAASSVLTSAGTMTYGSATVTNLHSAALGVVVSAATGNVSITTSSASSMVHTSSTQAFCTFTGTNAGAVTWTLDPAVTSFTLTQTQAGGAAAGFNILIKAQQGGATGNQNGGIAELCSGANSGTGRDGSARLSLGNSPSNHIMVEAAEPGAGRRIVALCRVSAAADLGANTGDCVVLIAPAVTYPTAIPAGGAGAVISYDGANERLGFWIGRSAGGAAIEVDGTTAGAANAGAAALPANPRGFLNVWLGGTQRKIPYYDA